MNPMFWFAYYFVCGPVRFVSGALGESEARRLIRESIYLLSTSLETE